MMEGMPPGLIRRTTPPDDYETIYPCSIDPTEALVVEAVPRADGRVSFSMLLSHHGADESGCIGWETEYACLDRAAVTALVDQLQRWLDAEGELAIEEQITELQADAFMAESRIATAISEYRTAWCPCRLVDALEPLSPRGRDFIASKIGFADADHIAGLTDPCTCDDLWFEGTLPVDIALPSRPGVYICHDEKGRVAYVGTSRKDVRGRLMVHFRDPDKPRLTSWWAFYPGQFNDSAAVWEIRLIERLQPYLNRQHLDGGPEVDWTPQGYVPPTPQEAWWNRDDDYIRFVSGSGSQIDRSLSEPWQVATMIKKLLKEGITWEQIDEACTITAARDLDGPAMAYMVGVARNLAAQR